MITLKIADQGRSDVYIVFPGSLAALLSVFLVSDEAKVDMVASNSFSKPV